MSTFWTPENEGERLRIGSKYTEEREGQGEIEHKDPWLSPLTIWTEPNHCLLIQHIEIVIYENNYQEIVCKNREI